MKIHPEPQVTSTLNQNISSSVTPKRSGLMRQQRHQQLVELARQLGLSNSSIQVNPFQSAIRSRNSKSNSAKRKIKDFEAQTDDNAREKEVPVQKFHPSSLFKRPLETNSPNIISNRRLNVLNAISKFRDVYSESESEQASAVLKERKSPEHIFSQKTQQEVSHLELTMQVSSGINTPDLRIEAAPLTVAMATQSPQSGSQMEVVNIIAEEEDRFCRICKDDDELEQLVHPCACNGSVRHVHNHCLQAWVNKRFTDTGHQSVYENANYFVCEICKQRYAVSFESEYSWAHLRSSPTKYSNCKCLSAVFLLLLALTSVFSFLVYDSVQYDPSTQNYTINYNQLVFLSIMTIVVLVMLIGVLISLINLFHIRTWQFVNRDHPRITQLTLLRVLQLSREIEAQLNADAAIAPHEMESQFVIDA